MKEVPQRIDFKRTTPEQRRLAYQLEHAMESYYYAKDVVSTHGDAGMDFTTNDGDDLTVDAQMVKGVMKVVHSRYKDLRATGERGVVLARNVITTVQDGRKEG